MNHVAKSLLAALVAYALVVLFVIIGSAFGDEWERALGPVVGAVFIGPAAAIVTFVASLIYRVASAPPKPRPPELPRASVHSN